MKKLIAFDLDGTLVNTISDLTASLNFALDSFGYPTLSIEETERIVGHSVLYMCEHAVPEGEKARAEEVLAILVKHYQAHCCDASRPYPGIPEVIAKLRAAGYTLAVVSNKPHAQAVKVIAKLFSRSDFSLVLGRMDRFRLKPDPEPLRFAIDYIGASNENVIYVGDSEVDVQFANNTGVRCVPVSWGYRDKSVLIAAGAKEIADTPEQLFSRLTEGGSL